MRILVVDDSTIFRKVVRDTLSEIAGVEVIGVANDGEAALEKIDRLKPDLVTLDIEMPVMNGIEVLRRLRLRSSRPEVIMLSSLTDEGAYSTTEALRLGAFDFVLKPAKSSLEESRHELQRHLVPKVHALEQRGKNSSSVTAPSPRPPAAPNQGSESVLPEEAIANAKVVGIGISTGGPAALSKLIPRLPGELHVPLLIVQHMPAVFTRSLANELNRRSQITIHEAEDGQLVEPGHAYIAPGGRQMKVVREQGRFFTRVNDDPPERNCRPSVDYLFRSLSNTYGRNAMGIIMTGMGDDGTRGCRLLKRLGCPIVAQEESSCVIYGMPRQVVEAGLADAVTPLGEIHEIIQQAGTRRLTSCR